MTRQPTPDDILADVSQETDLVELVMGKPVDAVTTYPGTPIMIRLDWLKDNPYQPRQAYTGIQELAENIRVNGLLQAPVARERQGFYQLAFGHRRLRAYRHLAAQIGGEWRSMPVIVRPLTDEEMARQAWSENHNREDVSAVEEARLFQRMIDDFGLTQQEIADDVGKSRSAVANTLRLLQLPEQAQTLIETGKITERHGRELLRLAGAPKWLLFHLEMLIGDQRRGDVKTVSDLKRQIDQYIKLNGVLMPEEPIDAPGRYGDKEQHLPPAWAWGYAPKSPDVVGPCRFCPQLVNFHGDPAPRCTNGKCYEAKKRIWTDNERERQRLAALAAANAAAAAAPAPATGPRETQAEPATPRTIEKIEQAGYGISFFRTGDSTAPAALIEHGLCGKEQCECWCLARFNSSSYRPVDVEKYVRPDPIGAPEIAYACKSAQTLAARRRRLDAIVEPAKAQAENERRADLASQTKLTKELLKEFIADTTPQSLASSPTIVARLLHNLSTHNTADVKTLAEKPLWQLWEDIFWWLAERQCKRGEWEDAKYVDRWHADEAEKWIAKIRTEIKDTVPAGRPAQPGPGDSQKTNWENGWDDMDERTWVLIKAELLPVNPDTLYLPRVLLRAIETTDDKSVRGALWRRYNQLTNEGDSPHEHAD